MRNRAKCRKCSTIIESFHRYDYVSCKCGEISISGGLDVLEVSAKQFSNFLRVDDEGHEIEVTVQEKDKHESKEGYKDYPEKPTRKDLIDEFQILVKNLESLPPAALSAPVSHYDLYSFLLLLSCILQEER
jgi:hypothetical protein